MASHAPTATQVSLLDRFYEVATKLYKNYTLRVFIQAILTIWAVMTFTFFLIRLMPGNPIDVLIEQILVQEGISYREAYDRVAASFDFDPDATTFDQYLGWLGDLIRLDLGTSITSPGTKVIDEIARFLPWTVFAVGSALLIGLTVWALLPTHLIRHLDSVLEDLILASTQGVVVDDFHDRHALGMTMAYYRDSTLDHVLSLLASFMTGVPNYIWGLLILIVFGIQLRWIDIGALRGTYDVGLTPGFNLPFILSVLEHAALPIFTYVISTLGSWMLNMKSSTASVLNEDYVNVAEARGLKDQRIVTAYVGRNASLPLFTQLAISIGFVLGSGVVIEEIFVYWGLGHYLFASITTRDYTSMQGVFLILTMTVVFANLFSDLTYGLIDPRVRVSGEK